MALIYNATFAKNTRKLSFEDKAGNEIYSFTVPERVPAVDDVTKPLTFRATQNGSTVKLTKKGTPAGDFQTSRDGGNTWVDYTIGTAITLNTGEEVSFRAKSDRTSAQSDSKHFYFTMTGKIEAWHNVMSMLRTKDFATYESVVDYAFCRLFESCDSLVKAPILPATTLSDSCYWRMFGNCASLKSAPALPATVLVVDCYYGMFLNCQSLEKSPELPEATLASRCYNQMFEGCYNLNEVHCRMPSSYSSSDIASYASYWLSGVSPTGTFYTNADANWPTGASGIPENWNRVPAVDDVTKPLTFRAIEDGSTVTLTTYGSPSGSFQTSTDGGNTWVNYSTGTAVTLNTGDKVSFRAKSDRTSNQERYHFFQFKMTGKIEAWHNVMSMYRTNDFATHESVVEFAFYYLFYNCTSLTKAPVLPATTLAQHCYEQLFYNCSLKEAPELPATTLVNDCYSLMFYRCQSLTKAPALPATTLAGGCYWNMFASCQSLKEVRISATTTATDALAGWLAGVSATGDFYCDPNATIFPSGTSGIPQNWTRHALSDYPNP